MRGEEWNWLSVIRCQLSGNRQSIKRERAASRVQRDSNARIWLRTTEHRRNARMHDELSDIADRLRPVLKEHRVQRAIVFGSMARTESSRHSDLDLIIVMDTNKRFLDRYDGLLQPITQAADRPVDLLIYTPNELQSISHRPFIARALREGRIIYESAEEFA